MADDSARRAGALLEALIEMGRPAESPQAIRTGEILAGLRKSGVAARAAEESRKNEEERVRMESERERIAATAVKVEIDHEGRATFVAPDSGQRIMVPGGDRQSGNWTEAFMEFCMGEGAEGIAEGAMAGSLEMDEIDAEFEKSMEVLGMKIVWQVEKDGGRVSCGLLEYASQKHLGACRIREMKRALLETHDGDSAERDSIAQFRVAKILKDVDRGLALSKTAGEGKWADSDGLLLAA